MPATHNVVFQRIVLSMTIGLANNGDDNVVVRKSTRLNFYLAKRAQVT
jgi:hypothetical protein